jgi:hypothetical protein
MEKTALFVFAKKPFGSPKSVVEYLEDIQIAINQRIKSIDGKYDF